jgi:fucose 4-O-acetylase-like acetyltransferase
MPMFFILAGYLYKEKGILDSITHDFKRIILPYLLYFVILSLFNNLCYGITISRLIQDVIKISWGSVIRLDIYGHHVQGVGYLWFLPALFVCKNVFNIIYRVWKPITHSYGMYVCMYVCMLVGVLIHHKLFPLPFAITTGLNALGYYTIGQLMTVFIKNISLLDKIKWYYKLIIFLAWMILGKYALNGMGTCDYRFVLIDYLAGVAGTMVFYYIALMINKKTQTTGKGLAIIGRYTISILIIHQLVASLIWHVKLEFNALGMIFITCLVAIIYVTMAYNLRNLLINRNL